MAPIKKRITKAEPESYTSATTSIKKRKAKPKSSKDVVLNKIVTEVKKRMGSSSGPLSRTPKSVVVFSDEMQHFLSRTPPGWIYREGVIVTDSYILVFTSGAFVWCSSG